MEEKKKLKIKLSTAIILILIFMVVLLGIIYFLISKRNNTCDYDYYMYEYSIADNVTVLGNELWKIIHTYDEYEKFYEQTQENLESEIESKIENAVESQIQNIRQ